MDNLDIYEMVIDMESEESGVHAMSLVETPAIGEDWVTLSKQEQPVMLKAIDKEKRILMGAALVPDRPIYRNQDGKEFYIYFSKETIEKTSQQFFKQGNQGNATLEHKQPIEGATIVESWIVSDPKLDKSTALGLDVKPGTWMVSMKIDNDDIWDNYVKNDKVFGFSIEGQFANVLRNTNLSEQDQVLEGAIELIKTFIKKSIN